MVKKLSNSCPARHDDIPAGAAGHRLLRERDKNFNDLDKILHFEDSKPSPGKVLLSEFYFI